MNPSGKTLNIAISRIKAGDPLKRQGILLLNPGGPGGSGLSMPKSVRRANPAISNQYDLIGFDPRGIGRSGNLQCNGPSRPSETITRPNEREFLVIVEEAREIELNCQRGGGELRRHVSTANTARDMDVIRSALGEKEINYLGVSYGTYLGAVYGTLFPARMNLSVLDSAMHPDWLYYESTKQTSVAAKMNVDAWAAWAAQRDGIYHLGSSADDVIATIEHVSKRLNDHPVSWLDSPNQGKILDQNRFDQFMGSFGARPLWDALSLMVRDIRTAAVSTGVIPVETSRTLRVLSDAEGKTQTNGAHAAIKCEVDWPSDLELYREQMSTFRDKYPYGDGAMAAVPKNCTFRAFTVPEERVGLERDGYPAGLVVQASHDPKTPYVGGVAMADAVDGLLVTVRDTGTHGMHGENACATEKITTYLLTGTLPPGNIFCSGAPRPAIPAGGAAEVVSGRDRVAHVSLASEVRALMEQYRLKPTF
jgi:pimeloyl-ACP methyl ester carboxylesterase